MPLVFPWTRPPPIGTPIDWCHPLTRGLVAFIRPLSAYQAIDDVSGKIVGEAAGATNLTHIAAATNKPGGVLGIDLGMGIHIPPNNTSWLFDGYSEFASDFQTMAMATRLVSSAQSTTDQFLNVRNDANNRYIRLAHRDNSAANRRHVVWLGDLVGPGTSWSLNPTDTSIEFSEKFGISIASADCAGDRQFLLHPNGVLWADTQGADNDGRELTQIEIATSSGSNQERTFFFAAWWNGTFFEPDELRAFQANPWQIFEPQRRALPSDGEAPPPTKEGTGALSADDAALDGAGAVVIPWEGTGTLTADDAILEGVGEAGAQGVGILTAEDAALAGEAAAFGVPEGPGVLEADDAALSGLGVAFLFVHGSGALAAEDAILDGSGTLAGFIDGAGALTADDAALDGTGVDVTVGSGDLTADEAALQGAGSILGTETGTGDLQAEDATLNGVGVLQSVADGALVAEEATLSASGLVVVVGDTTLTPQDLLNIQDAVWAKLVNEGLVTKINEIWQRRGLDPDNPHTLDRTNGEIRVGNVTIDVDGTAAEVTQTRRP